RDTDEVILKVSDLFTALPPFIEKMDVLPSAQRRVIAAKQTLAQTFDDDGFKLLLKEANLVVETEARSDAYRLYYDIKRFDGTLLGSIVIEKATGIVEVVNPDGTPGTVPGSKKKTLDLPSDVPVFSNTPLSSSGAFNILIAGKHGALIDTIIFAHLDEGTSTIDLVSIPRDLYYKGRKINRYADMYGMDEFAKVMSEIVGYKLDKYVMIDMYAFIDVVDLIGGIDIHLEDAVVDPSYKTLDNGVWGTMHYEPGNYHLGGKESLRLARSRHTSSDFARAARQHKILEAIQGKLRNLGVSDATVVYDILKTVLNQTSTNIGLKEAASYYFKYQNFKLNSSNVLSTANVLTVPEYITSEECAALKSTDEMSECDSALQAYTLVPKNENWNLIKWYFQGVFE
ncbi:LCP family protein, partial [Candidatus Peregrinibacteria bacterium]|nr:LCP family protein [Candidatus Peregrinibacteria bacterium]